MLNITSVNNIPFQGIKNYSQLVSPFSKQQLLADKVSFGYDSPLKDIARHCAYCGCEMITEEDLNSYTGKMLGQNGSKFQSLIKYIQKKFHKKDSNDARLIILNELHKLSVEYPAKRGDEIIHMYSLATKNRLQNTIDKEALQIDNVRNNLNRLKATQPDFIEKEIDKLLEINPSRLMTWYKEVGVIVRKAEKEAIPPTEEFIIYSDIISKKFEQLKSDDLLKLASRETPHVLVRALLAPLLVTMEHIHPHSKGGRDDTFNYLPVCQDCNTERGNVDFTQELKRKPEIKTYIENCLKELKRIIKSMPSPGILKDYIAEVTRTLKTESKGQLDIAV